MRFVNPRNLKDASHIFTLFNSITTPMMRVASVLDISIGPPRAISVRKLVEFLRIYEEGKSKKMKKEEAMTKHIDLSDSY